MTEIRKIAFVLGGVTMTLTPDDIETIQMKWAFANPGVQMTGAEFADACMKHIKANAKLTRTVLHN